MTPNLSQLLAQRAALSPEREAIVDPEGRWSYAEFNARCDRLAAHLRAQGVARGDRVAVLARNGEFAATAVFAIARAGAAVVVLNSRLQVAELAYILGDSEPAAVLYEQAFAPLAEALRAQCGARHWLCHGDAGSADARYLDVVQATAPLPPLPGVGIDAEDTAVLMYTSGTTGHPKGAMLSHRALLWTAHGNSCTLPWNEDYRFLLVAPLFHIGGLSPLVTNVVKGCTTVLAPEFEPVAIWQTIAAERITNTMTVPVMLQALLAVAQKMPVDASSLKYASCGASAVPRALIEALGQLGITVYQVYGTTEFGGAVSYWMPSMGMDKAASQGKAVMFGEIAIVDPGTQQRLPQGSAGEIWCRGPMAFSGYWRNPEATAAALQDGWYRTGDLGRLDADGCLYVVDRLKDMIISGGENIYPAELEAVIARHPAVAEVAVVGRADAKWGEVPVAHIVPRPGAELDEASVIAWCREHLAGFKCVKAAYFVDALPRSAVGKVLKPRLRATSP